MINKIKKINKSLITITVLLCLSYSNAQAAAAGTHVYLAEQWLEQDQTKDRSQFILGTLLPDIRYLAGIKRSATHHLQMNLQDIRFSNNSFQAGMDFHSWVDIERERFTKESGVFQLLPDMPQKIKILLVKIVEDQIIWNKLKLARLNNILKQPLQSEEQAKGIKIQHLYEWRNIMQIYFSQDPTTHFINAKDASKKLAMNLSDDEAKLLSEHVTKLAQDKQLIQYTEQMLAHLTNKFALISVNT